MSVCLSKTCFSSEGNAEYRWYRSSHTSSSNQLHPSLPTIYHRNMGKKRQKREEREEAEAEEAVNAMMGAEDEEEEEEEDDDDEDEDEDDEEEDDEEDEEEEEDDEEEEGGSEEEDELEATVHQETTGKQACKVVPTKRGRYVHEDDLVEMRAHLITYPPSTPPSIPTRSDSKYAPPTEDELKHLRETEDLFTRNLLRLQLTEVLTDVRVEAGKETGKKGGSKSGPGGKALKNFLFALREELLGMESGVSKEEWREAGMVRGEGSGEMACFKESLVASYLDHPAFFISSLPASLPPNSTTHQTQTMAAQPSHPSFPFTPHAQWAEPASPLLPFLPPTHVDVVGSFMLGTLSKPVRDGEREGGTKGKKEW